MSKKVFTLIHGDKVHLGPKKKILKAEEISEALTAVEMLDKVKEDAEKYRHEVAVESEKIKEEAQKEGFEEGFKKWAEHIVGLEKEIQNVRQDVEKSIIPVALMAAKKIVGREISLSQDTIVDIVSTNLKAVAHHKKIKIYANKNDLEILEKNKNKLKQVFEGLESLTLVEKNDVAPGGCIIETEGGIINAQLENQWRVLEKAFQTLIKH